jgi:chromosome segregation ATPase
MELSLRVFERLLQLEKEVRALTQEDTEWLQELCFQLGTDPFLKNGWIKQPDSKEKLLVLLKRRVRQLECESNSVDAVNRQLQLRIKEALESREESYRRMELLSKTVATLTGERDTLKRSLEQCNATVTQLFRERDQAMLRYEEASHHKKKLRKTYRVLRRSLGSENQSPPHDDIKQALDDLRDALAN